MELFWWFLTIVLFAVGLIGTIAPVLPGTTIILAAAIIHRIMLGPDKSIGWHTIIVLGLLTLATYGLDVLAGYFGAKYFGATKWGTFGAILGALVGLFFGLIGLFVGPGIGAIVGEVIAGQRMIDAGRAWSWRAVDLRRCCNLSSPGAWPRVCHCVADRAGPRCRDECIFYLARSQKRWPPVYFIGNEIGATGDRAKPAYSCGVDRLVF